MTTGAMTSKSGLQGKYKFTIIAKDGHVRDEWEETNLIPTEGLNHILNVLTQAGTSKVATWYVGIGTGAYTASVTDTGANLPGAGRANETSNYNETTRVALVLSPSTAAQVTNSASPATFTLNATTVITNVFVVSTATKGDVTGIALSSLKLAAAKTLDASEQLAVTFTLSAASV